MNFWDSIDYSKARKVLVIPNITNSSNIDKDSFVDVIHNHIKALEPYGDYFWNMSFPSSKLINLLKDIDYDVIYSHLPDWVQVGRYKKSMDTKIVGYCHWWEMKSCNGPDNREGKAKWLWLPIELLGVSQMDVCYLNTQDQKNRVLDEARETFNEEFVQKLDGILKVWNLGLPKDKIVDGIKDTKDRVIVFNHQGLDSTTKR